METITGITECCICTEVYTDPRILPCIHTFCLKCLQETAEKSGRKAGDVMPCPICREKFTIPVEGIAGLQKNFFLERLIEVDAAKSSKPSQKLHAILCEICIEQKEDEAAVILPAICYCIQCEKNICNGCCRDHRKFKDLMQHQLVEMRSQLKEEPMQSLSTEYCDRHSEEKSKMYCADCKRVICVLCFAESHQMHKFSDIKDIAEGFRNQLRVNTEKMNSCFGETWAKIKALHKEKSDFLKRIEETKEAIVNRREAIKAVADECARTLLMKLESITQRGLEDLEKVMDESERQKLLIDSFTRYCSEVIDKGTPGDICRSIRDLNSRTEELSRLHKTQTQHRIPAIQISLQSSSLKDSTTIGNIFGQVNEENKKLAWKTEQPNSPKP